jgi:hypothetical protein
MDPFLHFVGQFNVWLWLAKFPSAFGNLPSF